MPLSLETEVIGIGNLLRQGQFVVPEHQRAYSWKDSEVSDLWRDVRQAMDEEPHGYFLGQVVLGADAPDSLTSTVIDGQQRLATVSLLYAAIAAIFRSRDTDGDDNQRAAEVDRDYLASKDKKTLERTPYLQLGPIDNGHFQLLIEWATTDNTQRPKATRESHERLDDAYDNLIQWLEDLAPESDPNWRATLIEVSNYFQDLVSVINVQAGSEDNAFLIFETLNDRGVRLAPADLLKNLLFSRSKSRLPEVQNAWSNMVGIIEAIDEDDSVTTFVRHHWISSQGQVRDKQLYKTIKGQLKTPKAVAAYASELAAAAEFYVSLTNPESKQWTKETEREGIRTIILFRARTVRPLLLAIAETATPAQQAKLVGLVSSWTVRLAVAGGLGGGSTEEAAGAAARAVRAGKAKTIPGLRKVLGNALVTDGLFENVMRVYRSTNGRQARYLLRTLELRERELQGMSTELAPQMDEERVNLEHVLPKNPSPQTWTHFPENLRDLYKNRLGNQVLLVKKLNDQVKNAEYAQKSSALSKSDFLLTKAAGGRQAWTTAEIDDRQEELARLATKTW